MPPSHLAVRQGTLGLSMFSVLAMAAGAYLASHEHSSAQGQQPVTQRQPSQGPQAKRHFRLNDGTELPIEDWPETYEAIEWQPPLDPKNAKTLVEYDFSTDLHVVQIGLDPERQKVYWFVSTGGGRHGRLCRANYDGSDVEILLDHYPGSRDRELLYPRALCVAPEVDAVYWVGTAYHPNPGQSIFRADLNGNNAAIVVTGLESCASLYVDVVDKKIYWHDEKTILRAGLNGQDVEKINGMSNSRGRFGIDIHNKRLFRRDGEGILAQADYSGMHRSVLLEYRSMSSNYPAQISYIPKQDAVFVQMASGIYCVWLKSPGYAQQLTRGQSSCYAVDVEHHKLFWSDSMRHGGRLVSDTLPHKWPSRALPAPPRVSAIEPLIARQGQEVTLRGTGFKSTRAVFMIGNPGCELIESRFKTLSDEQLAVTVPKFVGECREVLAVVVSESGVTVTVPPSFAHIAKVVQVARYSEKNPIGYWVADRGSVENVENAIGFATKGSVFQSGTRGGNVLFAKNGAHVSVSTTPVTVFHEPFAEIMGLNSQTRSIAVPAIRASFVADTVKLSSD